MLLFTVLILIWLLPSDEMLFQKCFKCTQCVCVCVGMLAQTDFVLILMVINIPHVYLYEIDFEIKYWPQKPQATHTGTNDTHTPARTHTFYGLRTATGLIRYP